MTAHDPFDDIPFEPLQILREAAEQPAPKTARARVLGRLEVSLASGAGSTLAEEISSSGASRPDMPGADLSPAPPLPPTVAPVSPTHWISTLTVSSPWVPAATLALGLASGVGVYNAVKPSSSTPESASAQHVQRAEPALEPVEPVGTSGKDSEEEAPSRGSFNSEGPPPPTQRMDLRRHARQLIPALDSGDASDSSDVLDSSDAPPRGLPLSDPRHQALLDDARRAIARQDGAGALAVLTEHRRTFPTSSLAEEREALHVQALALAGRRDEALARARSFELTHSSSLLLPAVRNSVRRFRDGNEAELPIDP